jgi:antirestriction protein ArdC
MPIIGSMTADQKALAAELRKQKIDTALATLNEAVEALKSDDGWRRMLEVAAMFHTYSLNNSLLIMATCIQRGIEYGPAAGFHTWKKLNRSVTKGEKGIPILAPIIAKREQIDRETGDVTEGKALVGFRIVHVWVAAQTNGEPLPEFGPKLLEGDGPGTLLDALVAITADLGYTLEWDECGGANGYTNGKTKTIRVRDDVDNLQKCKTLAHELGHVLCGHVEEDNSLTYHLDRGYRGRCEVEAESVAYLVLHWAGADSSDYTVPYVAGWAGTDEKAVEKAADRVRKAGLALIEKIAPLVDDEWIAGIELGTE